MAISRKDPYLNEILEILDMIYDQAGNDIARAYSSLGTHELKFIEEETTRCADWRYYVENYHIIRTVDGNLQTLYPLWDSQEIFYEPVLLAQRAHLPVRIITLKARRLGLSTECQSLIFHKTIFTHNWDSLIVAQDPDQTAYLFEMSRLAYEKLPWWMRPESRYDVKGTQLVFDRKDPKERLLHPGLRSQIMVASANKMSGISVGKALMSTHLCLTKENYVLRQDGKITPISEIKVGDRVESRCGPVPVSFVSFRESDANVSVTPWCNSAFPIIGTPNHRILCGELVKKQIAGKRGPAIRNIRWVELGKVSLKDCLVIPVKKISDTRELPVARLPESFRRKHGGGSIPLPISPQKTREWGFAIGLYLAEGSIEKAKVIISLDKKENGLASRFSRAIGVAEGKVGKSRKTRTRVHRFYNAALATWLADNFGHHGEKIIPDWAWETGRDFLLGIIEGLMLGDGHFPLKNRECIFCSICPQLSIRLRDAVASLGIGYGSLYLRKAGIRYGRNCKNAWLTHFAMKTNDSLRLLFGIKPSRKVQRHHGKHWYYSLNRSEIYVRLRKIEEVLGDTVYDIEVDSPNHEFLLPGAVTHNSELSLWPDPKKLAEYLFPTMESNQGLYFMESTSRGRHGFWPRFWKKSVRRETNWTPVFIESFRVRKYSIPIDAGENFVLTAEEKAIRDKVLRQRKVEIPLEHFKWRRKTIQDFVAANGDDSMYYQEFPATSPSESFVGTGLCAFDKKKLQRIREETCCDPIWFGEIRLEKKKPRAILYESAKAAHIPPQTVEGGRLYVWEMPEPKEIYYVSGDVAEGIIGGNFSDAQVLRKGKGPAPDVQVAEWHGWISPEEFAEVLAALGMLYNNAEIAPETNAKCGGLMIGHLSRVVEYENIFRWKHYDKVKNQRTNYLGWATNTKSRADIIAKGTRAVREGLVIIRSEELVEEMFDFASTDDSVKIEGQDNWDDRVMSFLIGYFCAHDSDEYTDYGKSSEPEKDRGRDFYNTESCAPCTNRPPSQTVFHDQKMPSDMSLYLANAPMPEGDDNELWKRL